MLELVADGLWRARGEPLKFLAFRVPVCAYIVRLSTGGLWVYSPIELSPDLVAEVTALGSVDALVAPNEFHHLYFGAWQAHWPGARSYGVKGLVEKRPDLDFDVLLDEGTHDPWPGDIETLVFAGNRVLTEAFFFHHHSRTLVLADLMLNVDVRDQGLVARAFARLNQVAHPDGGSSRLFRWGMKSRVAAREAINRAIELAPERVVIAHGEGLHDDAVARLTEQFAWLV